MKGEVFLQAEELLFCLLFLIRRGGEKNPKTYFKNYTRYLNRYTVSTKVFSVLLNMTTPNTKDISVTVTE